MMWWERLLKALGFNPIRLRWQWHRLKQRRRQRANASENRRRALSYRHKLCSSCNLTVDRAERQCPRCGGRLAGPLASRVQRIVRVLLPSGSYAYNSVFVALNVAFYLAMLLRSGGGPADLGRGIDPRVIYRFGAWTVADVVDGQLYRLVMPIFLHFGLLHLIFNCLWLVQLGPLVEQSLGRSRYLLLYLGSGVFGFAASVGYHLITGTPAIGAGASGVVFGLMAAALVLGYVRRVPGGELFRAGLVRWAILAVIVSFIPGVDFVAHFGGALAGGSMALVMAHQQQPRRLPDRLWLGIEILCLLLLVGSIVMAWQSPGLPIAH